LTPDIIISGEIELELEGGGSRTLKPGDVVVHRGT
jgi:quercetin dioxygenase-like cupin family protein